MKPNIEIRYNKSFAFFRLAINLLFFCLIIYEIRQNGFTDLLIGLLIVLSIYTLYLVIKTIMPAINRRIVIEVTTEGIIDNLHNRKLYWRNIDSMNYRTGSRASSGVVILNVQNPRSFYPATFLGTLQYWFNKIYDGYPIVIKTRGLDIGTEELFNKISEYYDAEVKKVK